MTLTIQTHIEKANVIDEPINYTWPKSSYDAYGDENPRFERQLVKISDRGILAFSAGTAEWIAWRVGRYNNDPLLFNYVEAVWAAIVDWKYVDPKNNPEDKLEWYDFDEPIKKPICAAAMKLGQTVYLASTEQGCVSEAVSMANLLEFIISNKRAFSEWRNWAIDQLKKLTPRISEEDCLGVPVPREALDPGFDFKPEMTEKLIDKYLTGLDYKKNPYLRTPEQMKKAGFKGTPYRYPATKK